MTELENAAEQPLETAECLSEQETPKTAAENKASKGAGIDRRTLIAGCSGAAVLLALGAVKLVGDEKLVRPPGGQDYAQLLGGCIHCGKCIEACPQKVIKFASYEDGILALRTPVLSFKADYCTWCEGVYDSPRCVEVCPTGALLLADGATAETTILGKADLDTSTCLAHRDMHCRFCYDACPYEAITLDSDNRPVLNLDNCNGCGACEAACVSLQNGSISSTSFERAIVVRAIDANGNLINAFNGGGVA